MEFYLQEMETIKEADDEDVESPENGQTTKLISVKTNPDLLPKTPDIVKKEPGFPRNFSTMSFIGARARKSSIVSNYSTISNMDFTGSSLQLHLQVRFLYFLVRSRLSFTFSL